MTKKRSRAYVARRNAKKAIGRRRGSVTGAQLRAEGVIEIGCIESVAFVRTERALHLFNARDLPSGSRTVRAPDA